MAARKRQSVRKHGGGVKKGYQPAGTVPGQYIVQLVRERVPKDGIYRFESDLELSASYFAGWESKGKKWMPFDIADLIICKGLGDATIWWHEPLRNAYLSCDISAGKGKKAPGNRGRSKYLYPKIRRMLEQGVTPSQVRKKLNISRGTVDSYIRRYGRPQVAASESAREA